MRATLAVVVSALLLAACGSSGSGSNGGGGKASTSGSSVTAEDLVGRSFVSAQASDGGKPYPITGTMRLAFTPDGISGSGGCNTLGGAADIANGVLSVDEGLMMTEMACSDSRLMDQDMWLAELLKAKPVIDLTADGVMLSSVGKTLRMVEANAKPVAPLEGTVWTLETLGSDGAASSVPAGVTSTLTIQDGRLAVMAGCNRGSAPARIEADKLIVGPMGMTRMACPPPASEVEAHVVKTLSAPGAGETALTIERPNGELQLSRGELSLTYRQTS